MTERNRRHNLYVKNHIARLLEKVYLKLGDRCSNPACQWLNPDGSRGCVDRRCLQIDHVNGDGGKERRDTIGRTTFLNRVIADKSGKYQILCANCNWIKRRIERGE